MTSKKSSYSLITYNIHKGFGLGTRFLLPEMQEAVSLMKPDFVFLQEVQGLHRRKAKRIQQWPDLPQVEFMAQKEWPHYLYAKNAVYQSGHHGNAILSKFPFEKYENINLSLRNRASRSILHAQINIGTEAEQVRLHLLCVHLGLFKSERALQCSALMQRIREAVPENEPLIMAGDFNDWRHDLTKPLWDNLQIKEAFVAVQGQHARSFPALKPTFCVDRIYFRGINVAEVYCLDGKPWRNLSDHLPLCAKFVLD